MATPNEIKAIIERNQKALRLRPSIGMGTATTKVRIRSGVACDIEDGAWKLVADESPDDAGDGLGPDPGVFGRAALGTCLAMGYVQWAAAMEVPIDSVEVVVEADYNAAAMFGVDDSSPPGWGALRYTVDISSPASEERVRELVDYADRHSPLLDDFARPVPIARELRITSPLKK
jgi:uncharacterized OsmC-like protein